MHKVGLLHYVRRDDKFISPEGPQQMKDGLARIGYTEGENISYVTGFGERDLNRTIELAHDMVAQGVDVIVSYIGNSNKAAQIAAEKSKTPIVAWSSFPIQEGLAETLQKPAGNVTGFTHSPYNNFGKVRGLLIAKPDVRKIGYLYNHTYAPGVHSLPEIENAVSLFGRDFQVEEALADDAMEAAILRLIGGGCDGIIVGPHEMINRNGHEIGRILQREKIVATGNQPSVLETGGIAIYKGPGAKGWAAMPTVVDRILKGEKPGDIPFSHAYTPIIGMNTAAAAKLSIDLPQYFLREADYVLDALVT